MWCRRAESGSTWRDVTRTWRAQGEASDQTQQQETHRHLRPEIRTGPRISDQLRHRRVVAKHEMARPRTYKFLPHELRHPSSWSTFGQDMTWTLAAGSRRVIQAETVMSKGIRTSPARMPVAPADVLASHRLVLPSLATLSAKRASAGMPRSASWLRSDCTCQPRHQCPDQWQDASAPGSRTNIAPCRTFECGRGLCWRWKRRPIRGLAHPRMEEFCLRRHFTPTSTRRAPST